MKQKHVDVSKDLAGLAIYYVFASFAEHVVGSLHTVYRIILNQIVLYRYEVWVLTKGRRDN